MLILIIGFMILSKWTTRVARKKKVFSDSIMDGKFQKIALAMTIRFAIGFLLLCLYVGFSATSPDDAGSRVGIIIVLALPSYLYVIAKCGSIIRKRRKALSAAPGPQADPKDELIRELSRELDRLKGNGRFMPG